VDARVRIVLAVCCLVILGVMLVVPRIPQPSGYHQFADRRAVAGIANAFDVLSNIPFAIVGAMGLAALRRRRIHLEPEEHRAYTVFFTGILLTSVGSAFYHLAPDNARLVWDRLPMTLAFMGLFTAIVAERLSASAAGAALLPLICIGAGTVGYWYMTEVNGAGDLRPYLLVQFLPLAAIPLMIALLPPKYTGAGTIFIVLGLYGVAKILELFDAAVFSLGGIISGHTLKHLVSAAGAYLYLWMLVQRRPVSRASAPPTSTPPRKRRVPTGPVTAEGAARVVH
jgi:hypothetical protein